MIRTLLVLLGVLISIHAANAGDKRSVVNPMSAEALIEDAADRLLRTQQDQIAEVLLSYVQTEAVAKFTLGNHARTLSEEHLSRYTHAFESWLYGQVSSQTERFSELSIEIQKVAYRNQNDAVITTRISHHQDQFQLRWRVIRRGEHWGVVDLEFAGIWLAIEQRAQVDAILDKPGANIEQVIARLG